MLVIIVILSIKKEYAANLKYKWYFMGVFLFKIIFYVL
jgi:hypothetical protein